MRDFAAHVRRHLPATGLPAERYDSIVDELASELEARYTTRLDNGATDEEAWQAVTAEIPSWMHLARELAAATPRVAHKSHERRTRFARLTRALSIDHWTRDIRMSWRALRKDRGFAAAAVVTLAIGLGGHAAMLAAINATLLHPLDAPDADRIYLMASQYPRMEASRIGVVSAPPDYEDRRTHVAALEDQAMYNFTDGTIDSGGVPTRMRGIVGTPSLLYLLRAPVAYGRLFVDSEGTIGNDQAIVLTDGLWREHYGADARVIGRVIRMSGRDRTIVGILRPGFTFGATDVRFYIPLAFTDRQRSDNARHSNGWVSIGRLRPGATIEQARAQLSALDRVTVDLLPKMKPLLLNAGFYTSIDRLQDVVVRDVRGPLTLLWIAALVVLVVGVANVASLAVARSRARLSEFGTRLALGARRLDIIRQFVVEGLLVSAGGMSAGLLLAFWLRSLPATILVGRDTPPIDAFVVAASAAAAVLAGLVIALVSAFPLLTLTPGALLQQGTHARTQSRASRATRRTLVVAQMACAFVLLVGAGLLWISLRNLLALDTGLRTEGVVTANMSLPATRYTAADDARGFATRSLETIRRLPGVTAAAITSAVPLSGNYQSGVVIAEGYTPEPGEPVVSAIRVAVTPGYFETVGTPLIAGRYFDERDNDPDSRSMIIDEALARRFWPNGDAIGRRMFRPENPEQFASVGTNTRWLTVVGIVRFAKLRGPAAVEVTTGAFYLPYAVTAPRDFGYVVRSHADTGVVVSELRSAMASIDREAPLFDIRTLDERTTLSLMSRTSTMRIASMFATVALFLSLVGLYGTLAYLVSQRRREFGVRVAVGGTPRHILGLVLREGLVLALSGVAIGGGATFALRRALSSQLFGIGPADPRVLVVITISLTVIAIAASLLPARSATRVDVMKTLKAE
jgi:putative ABC transport system permease protein